jgi:formylglycine-generating enzyme required for sulfatase activity
MVLVPAGRFLMGSPDSEAERSDNEGPRRQVSISRPFYLGVYPVTQRECEAVMGKNPAHFHSGNGGSPDHPVEQVSWTDAVEFCRRLSHLPPEKVAGRLYRLPTEAEWEYACRAGTTTPFWWGEGASSNQANFNGQNPYGGAAQGPHLQRTTRVGSYHPNPWGLFDVHGNVYEWCSDWFDENYYQLGENNDPQGPKWGQGRVLRGGSWLYGGNGCRAAFRTSNDPDFRWKPIGFRVALTIPLGNP